MAQAPQAPLARTARCPRSGRRPARGWELDGRQDARRRSRSLMSTRSEKVAPPVPGPLGASEPDTGKPKGSVAAPWRGRGEGGRGRRDKKEGSQASRRPRACATSSMNRQSIRAPAESRGQRQTSHVARAGRKGGARIANQSKRRQRAEGRVHTTVASLSEARGGTCRPWRLQGSVHPLRPSCTTCRCSTGPGQRRCCPAHREERAAQGARGSARPEPSLFSRRRQTGGGPGGGRGTLEAGTQA